MKYLRILATLAVCALSAPAMGQTALRHLSGEFRLNSSLDLTRAVNTPFSATLTTRTGAECLFAGTFAVQVGASNAPRRVSVMPGTAFIRCPGEDMARVVGQLAPADWAAPQDVRCRSRSKSGCSAYSTSAPVGTKGLWITWHALTKAQLQAAAESKGMPHD